MNGQVPTAHQWLSYVVTGAIVLAVLFLRVQRSRTARPLKVQTLWIVPAFMLLLGAVAVAGMLSATGFHVGLAGVLIMAGGLAAGTVIGWWRGRSTKIAVDPQTRVVTHQATGLAIGVIVVLLVVRMGLKMVFAAEMDPRSPQAMDINLAFLLFAIGFLSVARLEMWLRARALLAKA